MDRIVVERAVRLDVHQPGANLRRDVGERLNLLRQRLIQFRAAHEAALPTKAVPVRVAGMCANCHAVGNSVPDGLRHGLGVTRVTAARNAAAADNRKQLGVFPAAFADIRIEIDAYHLVLVSLVPALVGHHRFDHFPEVPVT